MKLPALTGVNAWSPAVNQPGAQFGPQIFLGSGVQMFQVVFVVVFEEIECTTSAIDFDLAHCQTFVVQINWGKKTILKSFQIGLLCSFFLFLGVS